MKQFNCLVLEDSLSDQLSIELLLNQYPEIKPFYTNSPESFAFEMTHIRYNLVITNIKLSGTVMGIDLLRSIEDPSTWVIICNAYDCKAYYDDCKSLPFTKFYLQNPWTTSSLRRTLSRFFSLKSKV